MLQQETSKVETEIFVGEYVYELRDALIASVMTNSHAAVISPPGWGKSAFADQLGRRIAGDEHFNLIPLDPSSLPSAIKGQEKLENGNFVLDVSGTPYDPEMKITTLDEYFRANDTVFDAGLHATDPLKQNHCVTWITSNFVPQHERVQASISRIAIWLQIQPEPFSIGQMAETQMRAGGLPRIPGAIPEWSDVEDVRSATPGQTTIESIRDYLEIVGSEANEAGLNITPRQVNHWQRVLFHMNVYHTGSADTALVPEAQQALRFVWPSVNLDAWNLWQNVVGSIVDPVGAAIDAIMANVAPKFQAVAKLKDESDRVEQVPELGRILAEAQAELYERVGEDDDRVNAAVQRINKWYMMAVRGETVKLGQ